MNYTMEYAGDNIRLLLRYKGWTQNILCKKTGITITTLRRRLRSKPATWTMTEGVAISKCLGASVNDVFFTRMTPIGNKDGA